MSNKEITHKNGIWQLLKPYIELLLAIMVLFLIVNKSGFQENVRGIQIIMLFGVVLTACLCTYSCVKKGFDWGKLIYAAMAIGLIMRIGYMLYTPYQLRSHDLGDITLDGYGHAAYILKILVNHTLPDSNWVQFYHPPLFHFLAACMVGFMNLFMGVQTYEQALEAAKIVSCFASCGCLFMMPKLCKELNLSERAKFIAVSIIAVFPNCYLLAGRVNNDSLVTFFMIGAVLFTLRWLKDQSWYHTVMLALCFGLGMMTKTSCSVLAFFTGPVMLYVFWKKIREKEWKGIFVKLASFAVVAFPLGLWYPIRNLMKFDQPLNYVAKISVDSEIYTGNVSFFERFIQLPIKNLFEPIYADPWSDYNISLYTIKSSIFGEFSYDIAEWIPKGLIFVNFLLILLSVFGMVYMVIKIKGNNMMRFGMPLLWLLEYGFFLYFNASYPFGCTMDYRYIVITAFTGALFLGTTFDHFCDKKSDAAIALKYVLGVLVALFYVFSVLMFCFIKN